MRRVVLGSAIIGIILGQFVTVAIIGRSINAGEKSDANRQLGLVTRTTGLEAELKALKQELHALREAVKLKGDAETIKGLKTDFGERLNKLEQLPRVKAWSVHLGVKDDGLQDYTFDVPAKTLGVSAWVSEKNFGSANAITRTVTFRPEEMKCRIAFNPAWPKHDSWVNIIAVYEP